MDRFAIMFPGQGTQYVGMGKYFYDNFEIARKIFQEANDILDLDISKICFEGNIQDLTKTESLQPAILTTSVAMFKTFEQDTGIKPYCSMGHSLGEYSALCCSGALSFSDALRIVRKRGILMKQAENSSVGMMAAIIGVDNSVIEEVCKSISTDYSSVVISGFNSPQQTTISGHKKAVKTAVLKLEKYGAKTHFLNVSAAFHSPLMQSAADKLKDELNKYIFNRMNCKVISNVTGLPYENEDSIIENLVLQMTQPVKWTSIMKYLQENHITHAIEIGPHEVLKNLFESVNKWSKVYAYDNIEDRLKMKKDFSPKENRMYMISRCMGIAVCIKNNNSDNEEYERGVVIPYNNIKEMYKKLEREKNEPSIEQMKDALDMLVSVFRTKKIPIEEGRERIDQLFNEAGTRHLFEDFNLTHEYI